MAARRIHARASSRRGRGLLPQPHGAGSARFHPLAHGRPGCAAGACDGELGRGGPLARRWPFRRWREDAARDICLGRRVGREELPAEAAAEAHQAALVPSSEGSRLMSEEKEAFLSRWSRLKREQPTEKQAEPETPAPVLPPVESLTPQSDYAGFMHPKVKDDLRRLALKKLFGD